MSPGGHEVGGSGTVVVADDLRFDPPGPGGWAIDLSHGSEPSCAASIAVHERAFEPGFRTFTAHYGLALSHVETAWIHGYGYGSPRIAGVPPSDGPPPPDAVLRVLVRLHPLMVRRALRARRSLRTRSWVAQDRHWHEVLRPARVHRLLGVQQVDPHALDAGELADHVLDAEASFVEALREHFDHLGAAVIPVGLYVRREEAAGADPAVTLAALDAEDPDGPLPMQRAVALQCAHAGVEPTSLDAIRAASPGAADLLDAYLAHHAQRIVTSFDLTGLRLVELPELVVRSIAVAGEPVGAEDGGARPNPDDRLLAEARRAQLARNAHAGTALWGAGLLRRALLAAGERLAIDGALSESAHVFDATAEEVTSLLGGATGPAADLVEQRHQDRLHAATIAPPLTLGPQQEPPGDDIFPRSLRTLSAAVFATMHHLERAPDAGETHVGIGLGTGRVVGRAVVAGSPEEALLVVEDGDVLVTATTTPAYDSVLGVVAGLVTEEGGLLSHAAITARALGIPAVIGLADACTTVPDGATVELDPGTGTVTVLP